MILGIRRFLLSSLATVVLAVACSNSPAEKNSTRITGQAAAHPTIVFMTDFGTANDAVAICKAVMIGIAPDARILDITHQVTPYSIEEGSRFLEAVTPYYPADTIFAAVI